MDEDENRLEQCLAALPVLQELAGADKPLRVVSVGDADRRAFQQIVNWLSELRVQEDDIKEEQPGPSGSQSQRDMFSDYLLSFSRPAKNTSRGQRLGKPTDNWTDLAQSLRMHKIAQIWREKAARAARARNEQMMLSLQEELQHLQDWNSFNCFAVDELSNGRPLEMVTTALFHKLGLPGKLKIPIDKLRNFVESIETIYAKANPYHNSLHASDVVQGVACLVCSDEEFSSKLTDLEVLSLVLAACIHDCGHPGVNNAFLVLTNSDPAYCYNDMSVNENMHLACAFRVLAQPQNNFLCNLPHEDFRFVRKLVIDMVLSTDMAVHTQLLKQFQATVALLGPDVDKWEGEARTLLLKYSLHAFDISNPGRPWAHCRAWAMRIMNENFAQGDRESEVGIPVSPLNDRGKVNVVQSQKVFCDLFVRPTFAALAPVAPRVCEVVLGNCAANSARYDDMLAQGHTRLPDA